MNKTLKLIGYWNDDQNSYPNYPHPKDLIDKDFYYQFCKKHRMNLGYFIEYLDSGMICNRYRGFSSCRLCNDMLGSCERHDNVYVWPDKLSHYLRYHFVKLPIEFLEHVVKQYESSNVKLNETDWKSFKGE